jgi:hypothetical protein
VVCEPLKGYPSPRLPATVGFIAFTDSKSQRFEKEGARSTHAFPSFQHNLLLTPRTGSTTIAGTTGNFEPELTISKANANGWFRQIEMNERKRNNLFNIITSLEQKHA